MARSKSNGRDQETIGGKVGPDPWKRKRKERINHSPSNLPSVDVHGILFAVVAVVFVVYENRSLPSHCSTDACARKIAEGVGTVRVDVRSLLRKLRLQQAEMAYLRTWAATAGADYLPLQYDELRRDPVGVVSRIYAFLGVEAHATRPDLYARSMRRPLSEYVENLDEVREALRGTPWAADPVLTA